MIKLITERVRKIKEGRNSRRKNQIKFWIVKGKKIAKVRAQLMMMMMNLSQN